MIEFLKSAAIVATLFLIVGGFIAIIIGLVHLLGPVGFISLLTFGLFICITFVVCELRRMHLE